MIHLTLIQLRVYPLRFATLKLRNKRLKLQDSVWKTLIQCCRLMCLNQCGICVVYIPSFRVYYLYNANSTLANNSFDIELTQVFVLLDFATNRSRNIRLKLQPNYRFDKHWLNGVGCHVKSNVIYFEWDWLIHEIDLHGVTSQEKMLVALELPWASSKLSGHKELRPLLGRQFLRPKSRHQSLQERE